MNKRYTRTEKFFAALKQGLQYSFIEVIFLWVFAWGILGGGGVSSYILWTSFVLAAMWVLITNGDDAFEDAKYYVLVERSLFTSDFVVSTVLLISCALLVWSYPWWFSTMLALAAGQNLRYTAASIAWLVEAECEQEEDKDDQVPRV